MNHKKAKWIADSVVWIDGSSSNLYLCVEADGLTLIDTGMPKRAQLVFEVIQALGFGWSDLQRILITHADMDHAGSLAEIQQQANCRVVASAETAVHLQKGSTPKHLPWPMQFVVDRFLGYTAVASTHIDIVQEGSVIPILGGLEAIPTPGHTPDHYAFFSPSTSILFSGDILNTRGGPLHASPDRISSDPAAVVRSAIRLLKLTPAVIACGHGTPLTNHSADLIMELFNELRYKEV